MSSKIEAPLGWTLAVAVVLAAPGAASAAEAARIYAVIVANNEAGERGLAPLRYADDDGARYYELFAAYADEVSLFTVLDADTQRLFRDLAAKAEPPTWSAIRARLTAYFAAMGRDKERGRESVFYFVYAGHGGIGEGREGYVHLLDGRLTRGMLGRDVIEASPAAFNHVIVDACDAYFMVSARGTYKDDRTSEDHRELVAALTGDDVLARHPNTGVVLSTARAQEAHEWALYEAGVFSHELRSALVGAADVNGDGLVEYSEVKAYIAAANARIDDPKARVTLFAQPPRARLSQPLFDEARVRAGAVLELAASDAGKYYLEDARGVRYADFNKAAEAPLRVTLVPRSYYFLRGEDTEAQIPAEGAGVVHLAALAWERITVASRGATAETLRQSVFQLPYGPTFYDGFVASSGDLPVQPRAFVQASAARPLGAAPTLALAGAVALGAGAGVTGWLTYDAYDDFRRELRTAGTADGTLAARIDRLRLATNVLAGAAALSAAAAAWLYWHWYTEKSTVSIVPASGGLAVSVGASY